MPKCNLAASVTTARSQKSMQEPSFIPADPAAYFDDLLCLNTEYLGWVFGEIERVFGVASQDIAGMSIAEYVARNLQKVCGERPPRGVFYLIRVGDGLVGMCGLRYLREGVAEIKRLYIRPGYRGRNLGALALERLLSDAALFGYRSIYLDTGQFMQAAQRLYEAHGFVDCPAYEGVEVPAEFHSHWRFMQRPVLLT